MTKEEVLEKIKAEVSNGNKWYTSEATFNITRVEPWFNIQTVEQLPKEIKIPKYGTARIFVDDKGIEMNGDFYPWAKIYVTGYITQYKKPGKLVIGLSDGEIVDAYGPSEWRMSIDELGHLIELFKIKFNKTVGIDKN